MVKTSYTICLIVCQNFILNHQPSKFNNRYQITTSNNISCELISVNLVTLVVIKSDKLI